MADKRTGVSRRDVLRGAGAAALFGAVSGVEAQERAGSLVRVGPAEDQLHPVVRLLHVDNSEVRRLTSSRCIFKYSSFTLFAVASFSFVSCSSSMSLSVVGRAIAGFPTVNPVLPPGLSWVGRS